VVLDEFRRRKTRIVGRSQSRSLSDCVDDRAFIFASTVDGVNYVRASSEMNRDVALRRDITRLKNCQNVYASACLDSRRERLVDSKSNVRRCDRSASVCVEVKIAER